jgi:hypothetical protein
VSVTNGSDEQAIEITAEIRRAHEALLQSFAAFMQAWGLASEVGIDAGAAIRGALKDVMPEEAWAEMPPMLKMLLT